MPFPYVTGATAGAILILQMALGFAVSNSRNSANIWIGHDGQEDLLRSVRRHGNLAENAGVFIAGFTLLELSGRWHALLVLLCVTFFVARLLHAAGLSRTNTRNIPRLVGSLVTSLAGVTLGASLLWICGASMLATAAVQ